MHEDRTGMEKLYEYVTTTQRRNHNLQYRLMYSRSFNQQQPDFDYFYKVKIPAVHTRVSLVETIIAVHRKGLVFFIKDISEKLVMTNGLDFWPSPEIAASKFDHWEIMKKLVVLSDGPEFIKKKYSSIYEQSNNYIELSYQLYDTLAKRIVADSASGTNDDILIPNLFHEGEGVLLEFENSFSQSKFIDYLKINTRESFEEKIVPNESDNAPIYDLDHRNMNLDAVYLYKNMAVKERNIRNLKKKLDQCAFKVELSEEVFSRKIVTLREVLKINFLL